MFTKIYPSVKIYKRLPDAVFHHITNKKVVSHDNTQLPHYFNIIHLYANVRIHNLNKYGEWQ